jgi:hypothetical protein
MIYETDEPTPESPDTGTGGEGTDTPEGGPAPE